jgi:hypothetical protein
MISLLVERSFTEGLSTQYGHTLRLRGDGLSEQVTVKGTRRPYAKAILIIVS